MYRLVWQGKGELKARELKAGELRSKKTQVVMERRSLKRTLFTALNEMHHHLGQGCGAAGLMLKDYLPGLTCKTFRHHQRTAKFSTADILVEE